MVYTPQRHEQISFLWSFSPQTFLATVIRLLIHSLSTHLAGCTATILSLSFLWECLSNLIIFFFDCLRRNATVLNIYSTMLLDLTNSCLRETLCVSQKSVCWNSCLRETLCVSQKSVCWNNTASLTRQFATLKFTADDCILNSEETVVVAPRIDFLYITAIGNHFAPCYRLLGYGNLYLGNNFAGIV